MALAFDVYTPVATVRDFGLSAPGSSSRTLPTKNTFSELNITGFGPSDKQTISEQPRDNDYRVSRPKVSVDGSFAKLFVGVPGTPRNQKPAEFSPGDIWLGEGLPGGATVLSGLTTVAPTQEVISMMRTQGASPALPTQISTILCDSWDNSKLHLKAKAWPASQLSPGQMVGSEGKPVWVSGYNNLANATNTDARPATSAAETPPLKVQYSSVAGGAYAASECGDAQGPWYF